MMASDDPNPAGQPPRSRPTPPTLDLTAEEVRATPESGAAPAVPADPAGAADDGPPSDRATGAPDDPAPEAIPSGAASEPGAPASEEPEAPAPAAPRRASGALALAAALVAGVVGGGVAGAAVSRLLAPQPALAPVAEVPPAVAADLKTLAGRLAALEARPAAAVPDLSGRLGAAEASLAAIKSGLATLEDAAKAASASTPAVAAADLQPVVDGLKAQLDAARAALDGARGEIAQLRQGQEALDKAQAAMARGQDALKTAVDAAARQSGALAPRLDAFDAQLKETSAASVKLARAATALVVLAELKQAAASGRPFAAELDAARAVLGPAAQPLDAIAADAKAGLPTNEALARALAQQGGAAFAVAPAAAPAAGDDLFSRLAASAGSLVKVRREGEAAPGDARAPLDQAVAEARAGALGAALASLKRLPPEVQAKLADVTAKIAARRAAADAVAALSQQSLAAISGKTP